MERTVNREASPSGRGQWASILWVWCDLGEKARAFAYQVARATKTGAPKYLTGGSRLRSHLPRGDPESGVPFLHFFGRFRTSHEIAKIEKLNDDDRRF